MTSLQQQLRSIAIAAGLQGGDSNPTPSGQPSKSQFVRFPSLLYTEAIASDIHIDQLYNHAISAYNQLVRLDPRFSRVRKTLFVVPSSAIRIHEADASQISGLNTAVDIFCRLLQPYFLSTYAQHSLEYLIRMFHVHEHNVESLMKCGLVYHGSAEFSRLVRVSRIEGTIFAFLSAIKEQAAKQGNAEGSAAPLLRVSRNVLVARMAKDRALLRFVCDMAKEASQGEWKVVGESSLMGWYGVVVCEVLAKLGASSTREGGVSEEMVGFLLPYVVAGFKHGAVGGYRDATCMVVGGLSGKVVMSVELVTALVRDIASSATPASLPQTLLILSYLATSQPDNLNALAPQAFGHLSRLPNLVSEVSKLTSRKKNAARFGYLLMCAAVEQSLDPEGGDVDEATTSTATKNYDGLLQVTTLGDFSGNLAAMLLEKAKQRLEGDKKARLIEMLKLFDVYHGDAMDNAVNSFLTSSSSDVGTSGGSDGRKNVLAILESSLEDTVRAPLLDANVTLSAGIDHAQSSIRMMALERLNEICMQSDSKLKEEAEITLKGAVLRRLEDDDMGVVLTALNLSMLHVLIPGRVLIGALLQSIERCMNAVYAKSSGKRTRGLGRKAVKAALRRLDGLNLTECEGDGASPAAKVLSALLSVIFAGQASYTVSMEAVRILVEGRGPLAHALKSCEQKYADGVTKVAAAVKPAYGGGKAVKAAKRSRDGDAGAATSASHNFDVSEYNRDVIKQLAKAALSDENAYELLRSVLTIESPSCSPYAKATVLCVFEQSIMMSSGDKKASSRRDLIGCDVVQWFYASRDQPEMATRKSHQGLRALWDSKAKCISDQTMSDVASRMCGLHSIEPETVFMSLEVVSERNFAQFAQAADRPSATELYTYLAQLPADVYSQHLDVLLKKVKNPLEILVSVWGDATRSSELFLGTAATAERINTAATVASLRQWSTYASSSQQKLTEAEKQHVVKSIMALVCSMTHPSQNVRRAALDASERLCSSISAWWPSKAMEKWTQQNTIESLLDICAKNGARILGDADGVEYLLQQVAETSSEVKSRRKGKSPRASEAKPRVFFDSGNLCSFLMQELQESASTPLTAIPILVRALEFSAESGKLVSVAAELLDKMFYDIETESFSPSLDSAEKAAAIELVNVLNDPVLHQSSSQTREAVLRSTLCAAQWKMHPDIREVAIKALVHCSRPQIADLDLQSICRVLMAAASSESNSECRNAAVDALEKVVIKPGVLMPFLMLSKEPQPSSKRKKGGRVAAPSASGRTGEAPSDLTLCLHTLELLQWKKDIQGMDVFVKPLQDLVQHFLALSLSAEASLDAGQEESANLGSQGPALAGYGLQLCLSVLLNISEDASLESKTRKSFDTKAIVACASSAADHAVRTVALELLRSRIESNPECAMDHILQTVQTTCTIVSNELDKYSTGLAAKAMSTAAAAWISRGNSIHDLVSNVINAINDSSSSRKYAILGAIVDSMPSNATETMASIAYHLLMASNISSEDGMNAKGSWQRDAAFSMLSKRKKATCVSALGGMLQLCITCSKNSKFEILREANAITIKVLTTRSDALRRLQEQSCELVESYEVILQSILKELQIIGKSRATNSDPLLMELEDGAYAVLDSLKDTMNHVQFINSLVRSLSYKEMTDAMKRKSLQLISHVVAFDMSVVDFKDPALHQCIHDAVSALVLIVQDANGQTDICRQLALETLSTFIQRFGAHYNEVFLQSIPPTVDLAREADLPGVRGMALVCIASFINSMKNAVIPMVPRIIQSVVGSMSMAISRTGDDMEASEAENAAALTAMKALSEHLAAFLAPNLPDILGILLHENFCSSSGGAEEDGNGGLPGRSTHGVQTLANACRAKIASAVPARLLIGPLSTMLDSMTANQRGETVSNTHSTLHLLNMLAAVISHMDSTAVATYNNTVFTMVLKGLDTRRLHAQTRTSKNVGATTDVQAIEAASVDCMLQLVLKLNETKFKPIFYRLLEWATRAPPGESESSVDRKIAFFHVINTLTENLKSVFTSYFSAIIEPFLDALLYEADEEDVDDMAAVNTLQLMAMRSLTRCFIYDTSEFLDEPTFDKLLEPLVNLISSPWRRIQGNASSKSSKVPKASKKQASTSMPRIEAPDQFASIDLVDPLIDNTVSASCPEWMLAELSTFSITIIACLSQMTIASGMNNGEARWRPLHHAVLMATRANNAESRCTALETVMAICHTLQEEYLVLVPEALPFLSELLEDEDTRVEKRAVEVINAMSEKSGEDLQQYLTGN